MRNDRTNEQWADEFVAQVASAARDGEPVRLFCLAAAYVAAGADTPEKVDTMRKAMHGMVDATCRAGAE